MAKKGTTGKPAVKPATAAPAVHAGRPSALLQKSLEGDPLNVVLRDLARAGNEPRLLVIITASFIELMTNYMIEAVCKNAKRISDDNRTFPQSSKLTLLNEMKVLSDHHYKLLNWLRKLRNDSAHVWDFELNPDCLGIFVEDRHRDPANAFIQERRQCLIFTPNPLGLCCILHPRMIYFSSDQIN